MAKNRIGRSRPSLQLMARKLVGLPPTGDESLLTAYGTKSMTSGRPSQAANAHSSNASAVRRWLVVGTLVAMLSTLLLGSGRSAEGTTITGYRDQYFGAVIPPSSAPNDGPTAQKPQSKLWFNDGIWWGSLVDNSTGAFHIYRFNWAGQSWSDTGTLIDARSMSHADTLWDGAHLYIATAVERTSEDRSVRVLRYSYDSATRSYSLDTGFPVTIWTGYVEAVVIDKDSTGTLWATFTYDNGSGGRYVYVSRTIGNDLNWVTPYVLPFPGAANLTDDDISAVVAFRSQIGVMWSNQADSTMYFATHTDGDPDSTWALNPALQLPKYVDDHINLKSLQADTSGRVFAAVKTSLNDDPSPDPNVPMILLLVLDDHGNWSRRTFSRVRENETRPIVLIDSEHRYLYMFATGPETGGTIYYKAVSLDNINFPDGLGTPFIQSSTDQLVNNATSTKQNLSGSTGLLVEASDLNSGYYLHNTIDLTVPPPTSTPTPEIRQGGYPAEVMADSPVSYWRLGELSGSTAVDTVGTNNGTYLGGATLGIPGGLVGDSNTAVGLNGTTGYVGVPDNTSLDITSDLSVEAWVKPAVLNGNTGTIVHKGLSNNQDATWQYRLSLTSDNKWKAAVFIGGTSYSVTASNIVPSMGRWDHLVLVRSGSTLTFYVNGISAGSAIVGGALNTAPGTLAIGRSGSSSQFYFNGSIDEVAIYNSALSPSRIAAHYTAGMNAPPATYTPTAIDTPISTATDTPTSTPTPTNAPLSGYPSAVVADNPVSYWRLGELSGSTAVDSAGSNEGAIQGGVATGIPGALVNDPDTAMAFNGFTGYVGVPDSTGLNITGDLTLEAWARPEVINGNTGTIVHKGLSDAPDSTWQYRISLSELNQWKATIYVGGTAYSVAATDMLPITGRWDHLVLVRSGSTLTFYVNGISAGSTAAGGALNSGAGMLAIGRAGSSSQFYFNGSIDEVAIYNSALSPERVAAHYTAGRLIPPATSTPTETPLSTSTATGTPTYTAMPTDTATTAPTDTPTITATYTTTNTPTDSPTVTPTMTATNTSTGTPTFTNTPTPTNTRTPTPTRTGTRTSTPTRTSTRTPTSTATPSPTRTSTPVTYRSLVLGDRPVSYWRLGELSGSTAADSASGYNGTLQSGVVLGLPGALMGDSNTAMGFNGTSAYVSVGDRARLDISGDLAIEVWAKPAALRSVESALLYKGKTGKSPIPQYRLSLNSNNRWQGTVYVGNAAYSVTSPDNASTTSWQYLVLTRSGTTLTLYLNGAAVATASATGSLNTSNGGLSMACAGSGSTATNFFGGILDEVAIYGHALSAAQVQAHYLEGISP